MDKKILILLSLIVLCSFQQDINVPLVDILTTPKSILINLSEIADDISYIPLETSEFSLIDRIIYLRVINKYIYVGTLNKIFCFDKSGKYLFKLDKPGRGPDEYEVYNDFDVDLNNTLLVLSSQRELVFYRQSENGFSYLKRIKLNDTPETINFTGLTKNILIQYSNVAGTNPVYLELISLNGMTLKKWPNYMMYKKKQGIRVMWKNENTSYSYRNYVFVKDIGNDTVFKYSETEDLSPFLIFDSKNKRITPEVRSDVAYYAEHMYEYFSLQKIFGSERYLYYSYYYNRILFHEIFDLQKNTRFKVSDKEFLKDDISGGVNFEPRYCNNGFFYSWIEANKLKSHFASNNLKNSTISNPSKAAILKTKTENISEFDNPILVEIKVK